MIIEDKVYNVTSFLQDHPGGEDILVDSSGRDATREFEDVGHSEDARAQLKELYIGDLRPATEEELAQAQEEAKNRGESTDVDGSSGNSIASSLVKWLFPFVLIGVAYILRKYTASKWFFRLFKKTNNNNSALCPRSLFVRKIQHDAE